MILHSEHGREFCIRILEQLKSMRPGLKLVTGKPRHSQSQGSVERCNQDVEKFLAAWMEANSTNTNY